jgi:hypothetical protein
VGLVIAGVAATVWGDNLPYVGAITKELGPGVFTAGILASLVEPFFRKEFARDAFLASFRYVLPKEFKDEVAKILRFSFVAEKQLWTVEIHKADDSNVKVITSFEKTIRNKTNIARNEKGLYTVLNLAFSNGPVEILECAIECGIQRVNEFTTKYNDDNQLNAETKEIAIPAGAAARLYGKAIQYRRVDDIIYETFRAPAIDPEIEVIISDEFEHGVTFGTAGEVIQSAYGRRYKLSGVYFPGQFMYVRWWPKEVQEPG